MSEPEAEPAAPVTGEARVDEALRSVDDLDQIPVDEHADRLGRAHAALQDVLRHPDAEDPERDTPSGS